MVAPGLTQSIVAAARFGIAARPGDAAVIARDPRAWVLHQLDRTPAPINGDLPASAPMVAAMLQARQDKSEDGKKQENKRLRAVYLAEIAARVNAAAQSDQTRPTTDRATTASTSPGVPLGFNAIAVITPRQPLRPSEQPADIRQNTGRASPRLVTGA